MFMKRKRVLVNGANARLKGKLDGEGAIFAPVKADEAGLRLDEAVENHG